MRKAALCLAVWVLAGCAGLSDLLKPVEVGAVVHEKVPVTKETDIFVKALNERAEVVDTTPLFNQSHVENAGIALNLRNVLAKTPEAATYFLTVEGVPHGMLGASNYCKVRLVSKDGGTVLAEAEEAHTCSVGIAAIMKALGGPPVTSKAE